MINLFINLSKSVTIKKNLTTMFKKKIIRWNAEQESDITVGQRVEPFAHLGLGQEMTLE